MFFQVVQEIFLVLFKLGLFYLESLFLVFVPSKKKQIKNDLVLITGAGQGLGKQLAIQFSKYEAKLALIDINQENLKILKNDLEKQSKCEVRTYLCDVSNYEQVKSCIHKINQDFDQTVDILVNNAGIVNCEPILILQPERIKQAFSVNTLANFWTIQNVLPAMKKVNQGHIVCISSIAGLIGNTNLIDYCSTKYALIGLMDSLEVELRDEGLDGIKLTTICPLAMNTAMFKKPKSRFHNLLPIVDVKFVAEQTVEAILTEKILITIPSYVLHVHRLSGLMPLKARNLLMDFLNYKVDSHI